MSYGFGRDPELPAGFQDADFEMRDLENRAREVQRLEKLGHCQHGSQVGHVSPAVYYLQEHITAGQHICWDCGAIFEGNPWEGQRLVEPGWTGAQLARRRRNNLDNPEESH
jgi:hypothetical protein